MEKEDEKMVRRMPPLGQYPLHRPYETKLEYQRKIKRLQEQYKIPDELILNSTKLQLAYISAPNHTLEIQGSSSVPLVGKGKK